MKARFFPLSALAAALLLAGCTMAPNYKQPDPAVADDYPSGSAYGNQPGASSAGGRSANSLASAEIGWSDFFHDPRLKRLVEIALVNNRDLRVSVLNVEAAGAQYQITASNLFPQLSLAAGGSQTRTPAGISSSGTTITANQYSVGPSVSWVIDLFGRVTSLKDAALAQYLSLAETRKAAELALVAGVANQYLTVQAYDAALFVTSSTLKTARESLQIVQAQYNNGIGNELSLTQAQGVVSQALANFQAQLRSRAQAENALALLIGQPLPADLPPGLPLTSQNILADIPAGLPSDLIARRPDIAAAEQTLRAADANIGAARAAFFPTVSLTGAFGTAAPVLGQLFDSGTEQWSLAPRITLPLFAGGANVAGLESANVQQRIAIEKYQKAVQSAFHEVADGLAARGTYDQQIRELIRLTDAQSRRLELSDLRYRNGVDSYLSVITAQNDYYAAQQSLITAQLQRLNNLVSLYQALGGGWIEHTGDTPRPSDAPGAFVVDNKHW